MKKMLIALCALIGVSFMTSCTTIGPAEAGKAAGTAAYFGYAKVAEKQSPEFKKKVAELWEVVNQMETIDDLVACVDDLSAAFDKVIADEQLKPEEKAALVALKNLALAKVKEVMASKLTPDSEAVTFLVNYRAAVNTCIANFGPIK